MTFDRTYTLAEIAKAIGAQDFIGPAEHGISGLSIIPFTKPGDLIFADNPRYLKHAAASSASTILTQKAPTVDGKAMIFSEDPFGDFARIIELYGVRRKPENPAERIGRDSVIHPAATVGEHVGMGSNCVIHPHAVLYDGVILGDNVVVHANSVIGSDAFYYQRREGKYRKMPSCGGCVIGDDVEIGSGSTIDRGVTGDTRIGRGTKIDNQVHIGHDTVIGENCLLAGCAGVAGCVIIEDEVVLWGQAGVKSGVRIGRGAEILAQSAVLRSVEAGTRYFGAPAIEARAKMKELAVLKELCRIAPQLPDWPPAFPAADSGE